MSLIEAKNLHLQFPLERSGHRSVLRNINFDIDPGEIIELSGQNGAGKTTLMRLIAGILSPSKGSIKVLGKVGPLLSLKGAFSPELTGAENIVLHSTLLGISRKRAREAIFDIAEFAELLEFLDVPLKKYSTGMSLRLGLAILCYWPLEILLIDEAFAVLDPAFREKAKKRLLEKTREEGTSIIWTHADENSALLPSQRSFLLEDGRLSSENMTPHDYHGPSALE